MDVFHETILTLILYEFVRFESVIPACIKFLSFGRFARP